MDLVIARTAEEAIVGLILIAVAGFVLSGGSRRLVNAFLATYLASLGVSFILQDLPLFIPDRLWAYNVSWAGAIVSYGIAFGGYLLFLGQALETWLVAPLRSRAGIALLLAGIVAFAVVGWLRPDALQADGPADPHGGWNFPPGQLSVAMSPYVQLLIFSFGVLTAITAVARTERGSIKRKRAIAFLQGITVIDAVLIAFSVTTLLFGRNIDAITEPVALIIIAAGGIMLVRGLLRYQLFDFDLKVKWTLQRGTVAAIILGAFFIVAQVAQNYLAGALGWLAGGIAAGALLFAIRPIEHFAARLSDRAMPKTTGSPDYIAYRKLEVYRAAVESEIETHGQDHQEHAVLERLRIKLGISREDADALQREARERIAEASVT
jgi:hypothetical protein